MFVRSTGDCPYLDFRRRIASAVDGATVDVTISRLSESGFRLAEVQRIKKMDGIWELRTHRHRVFFFFDGERRQFVLLNGHQKQKAKAPLQHLRRADALMREYLDLLRHKRQPWAPWRRQL